MKTPLETIIVEHGQNPQTCVIWLHGLGADGHDFAGIVPQLRLPADKGVRFVFPHAPVRPITLNGGYPMRGWYDIKTLNRHEFEDDVDGIMQSTQQLITLIKQPENQLDKLILAGFSQGGALALYAGLTQKLSNLCGVLGLSTYLPLAQRVSQQAQASKALPIAMMHGESDAIVPMVWAKQSYDFLVNLGYSAQWQTYPMAHQVCPDELADISQWLKNLI